MPGEIVPNPPRPAPPLPTTTDEVTRLEVGQTFRADVASLTSLRAIASRVAHRSDPPLAFHCWEIDGKFYVERRA